MQRATIPIVGIGASAGGLDAFKKLFEALPPMSDMAFIIVQHLDPRHESSIATILTRYTAMKVVEIRDSIPIEANHVYVIPPNKQLTIQKNVLHLADFAPNQGLRLPIDSFYRSLAEDQEERALGVILSGTGTDGTLGLKAIKGHGGLVIVQSPETAQFDGMPRSAIATEMVDYIVPVEAMPDILIKYAHYLREKMPSNEASISSPDQLDAILAILRTHTKYDFRGYKKGMLMRRIARCMGLSQIDNITEYIRSLQQDDQEALRLVKDLLIGVTGFFRDPQAYGLLEKKIIAEIVREKKTETPIRVWVPGCATGEEPYSISILFHEQIEAMQKHCPVQIFATDIDRQALAVARAGVYPSNIAADISPERLQRFFKKTDQHYQVGGQLRDSVLFTQHNLLADPPFSKLDLISCRNLLIYLNPDVQKELFSLFHFSLKPGGYLFLGKSETVEQNNELFLSIDKSHRFYRAVATQKKAPIKLPLVPEAIRTQRPDIPWNTKPPSVTTHAELVRELLLKQRSATAVLIDDDSQVLYFYGPTHEFLWQREGALTRDLLAMVSDDMRIALRAVIHSAHKEEKAGEIILPAAENNRQLRIRAIPAGEQSEGLLLITFEYESLSSEPSQAVNDLEQWTKRQLEDDLRTTRLDLQASIEALEASNVELRVANEEAMSLNEELQSANEELETSREELQSMNEELTTVNSQLQDKVGELEATNADIANLLSNTDIAVLFLDLRFRIKRFTPATCNLFNLIPADIGRPISDISHRFNHLNLLQEARTMLSRGILVEKEICADDGYFMLRILPFRTESNKIDGIVATFFNISRLKQAEMLLTKSRERVELLLKSTGEAIYGVDETGSCTFVNNKIIKQLGYTADELIGHNIHSLIQHTYRDGSDYPWEESFVYRCLKQGNKYEGNMDDLVWRKDGTSFPALYTVDPILEDKRTTGAVVLFRDMTEAHALSCKLTHLARHDPLTGLLNRREFEARLEQILERTKQSSACHALCYLDLDQFKVINDSCGHLAGDQLLQQIAGVLSQHIRKRDLIARLGGDEFGILMENCSLSQAEQVAHNIRNAVMDYRFQWEDKTHVIGVSIGIVSIARDAGSLVDVLKAADSACYAAKEGGRNRFHTYHEKDTVLATRRGEMRWVARINRALEEDRLLLALQPITPLNGASHENISYEVLLRMQEKNGNIFLPTEFLGAAERYNLAIKVDRRVIHKIFKWHAYNKNKLKNVPLFNINISGQSLGDEDFLNFMLAELKKYRIPAKRICFEITETAAITNITSANRFIHSVKQLGCLFALDDFGTGLSSFGYLKTLPVEFLKISGLFVKDILKDSIDLAMVKSINEIGQVMGKKTIAESVESEEILAKLSELGVNYAQGYAVGKPVLLNDVKFFTKKKE